VAARRERIKKNGETEGRRRIGSILKRRKKRK
jgi:hypothetical protein